MGMGRGGTQPLEQSTPTPALGTTVLGPSAHSGPTTQLAPANARSVVPGSAAPARPWGLAAALARPSTRLPSDGVGCGTSHSCADLRAASGPACSHLKTSFCFSNVLTCQH